MSFNIYTNAQPQFQNIRRCIYVDDLCIAMQEKTFHAIETSLTDALQTLSTYYKRWFLNVNPGKKQVCTFHLNSSQAERNLTVIWEIKTLENMKYPVYLGVTLDRTLSFKEHRRLKAKVASRSDLLQMLTMLLMGNRSTNPKNNRYGIVLPNRQILFPRVDTVLPCRSCGFIE